MRGEEVAGGAAGSGEPVAVELMNTVDVDQGEVRDKLASTAGVACWLGTVADQITPTITDDAAARLHQLLDGAGEDTLRPVGPALRELRNTLRRLAAAVTDDPRPPITGPDLSRSDAITSLNAFMTTSPELVWPPDGQPYLAYRARGSVAELVVGLIAHQGVELLGSPRRHHLRACVAPNCDRFFLKTHSRREWCSPTCGNRARVARHYRRHHPTRQN
jgi:predicted RNA-binding Zn ribbon-like protein